MQGSSSRPYLRPTGSRRTGKRKGMGLKNNILSTDSVPFTVDVIIPVYNGEKYIAAALDSALRQTYPPQSIIVVDDGSTDHTGDIVLGMKEISTLKIVYVKKANGGSSSARNVGLACAQSAWIAFLDTDDVWLENKLQAQIHVIENTPFKNLGVVYGRYTLIDGAGRDITHLPVHPPKLRGNIFESLLSANQIFGSASAALIRRVCFEEVGGFDENLQAAEDWDMWLRIAEKFEYDFSDDSLVQIRRHDNNIQWDAGHMLLHEISFYEKWSRRLEGRYRCPNSWARKIAERVIADLPSLKLFRIVRQKFSPILRQRVFRVTFGSLHLYLWAAFCVFFWQALSSKVKRKGSRSSTSVCC
jgi:glycosyltransferase involved in cell wall biosynthesis